MQDDNDDRVSVQELGFVPLADLWRERQAAYQQGFISGCSMKCQPQRFKMVMASLWSFAAGIGVCIFVLWVRSL